MKCSKCGTEMVRVCDPATKRCYWECPRCRNRQ
jgi:DNA-directed RNA polymerase subunit RPC12/RpoP